MFLRIARENGRIEVAVGFNFMMWCGGRCAEEPCYEAGREMGGGTRAGGGGEAGEKRKAAAGEETKEMTAAASTLTSANRIEE